MYIRILDTDDWVVEYDAENNRYRISYFQNNHFVDEILFDEVGRSKSIKNKRRCGMKDGLYTRHEVACIIADLFGNTCACDYNDNDEWLTQYCDFADNICPNTVGVACWEQYLKHMDRREGEQND